MDTLTKFLVANPSLAVALTLGTVAVASALLMLIATLWIRPKVSAIDSLADRVTQLETRISSFPDFHALIALVNKLDGALQGENRARDAVIEDTIKRLESLHKRSQREVKRMVETKEITWAIEQAGQDVELAQSMEFFSRLASQDRHKAAEERLAKALRRLDELEALKKKYDDDGAKGTDDA